MIRIHTLASAALALISVAEAQRPVVVSLTPAHEDLEVDATAVEEMVVVFDRDMRQSGWSFCGGGPTFPSIPPGRRPFWRDARTCVLPVALKPDHTYTLSLNCPNGKNFASADGVPLAPTPWSFTTLPAALLSEEDQRESNRTAFEELRELLPARYSYYDHRGLDWDRLFARHEPAILSARTARAWAEAVGEMLQPTEDVHMYLRYGDSIVPAGRRSVDALIRVPRIPSYLDSYEVVGRSLAVGKTEDDIGYLLIGGWTDAGDVARIQEELATMRDHRALVVDVRPNAGGDERLARAVASWFVRGRKVYAKNRYREGKGTDGFGPVLDREIEGYDDPEQQFDGPVMLLTGPYVMSSNEAFVLMMRQAEDCTVVGQPTYGSSGNPQTHTLSNDVTIVVPSWQAMRPDGTVFEGEGLAPDVVVDVTAEDLESRDPILERALELLREKLAKK